MELIQSLFDREGVRRIFRSCSRLESFSLQWRGRPEKACVIDYGVIGKTLREYGTHLRDLSFDDRDVCIPSHFRTRDYTLSPGYFPLGDLTPLKSFQRLKASKFALLGKTKVGVPFYERLELRQSLPRSLTTLEIVNSSHDYDDMYDSDMILLRADPRFSSLEVQEL